MLVCIELLRIARWLIFVSVLGSGCADVSAAISGNSLASKTLAYQAEAKILRPGDVKDFLSSQNDKRMRTVGYRLLTHQRERLRSGAPRWTALDLVAITEMSHRDSRSDHQPLAKAAREQYVWARLEGLSPGELDELIRGQYSQEVVEWIIEWNRFGRPNVESRLNRADYVAVQEWAMQRLPLARHLLRWSLEQDKRPGQVAGFLSRKWTDQQLVEVLRMWCTSEGWSPLSHSTKLVSTDKSAVNATLTRLDKSKDPLVRREAAKWRAWLMSKTRPTNRTKYTARRH